MSGISTDPSTSGFFSGQSVLHDVEIFFSTVDLRGLAEVERRRESQSAGYEVILGSSRLYVDQTFGFRSSFQGIDLHWESGMTLSVQSYFSTESSPG